MSSTNTVFSIVGRSGSGKTTLIIKLISKFVAEGIRVGSIKHTHHDVEFDKKGKDSWRHKESGSSQVMLLSHGKMAIYGDYEEDASLRSIANRWFGDCELVISEGFKNDDCFKIEVTRQGNKKPPLYLDPNYNIQAVIADYEIDAQLPVFKLDDVEAIGEWLLLELGFRDSV